MENYKTKLLYCKAKQWFKHGDMEEVKKVPIAYNQVFDLQTVGWLDGKPVHPGDFIVEVNGKLFPVTKRSFLAGYEKA